MDGVCAQSTSRGATPVPGQHEVVVVRGGDDLQVQLQEQRLLTRLLAIEGETVRLGHYEVQAELGRRGMGVVYAAHDTKLDRKTLRRARTISGVKSALLSKGFA